MIINQNRINEKAISDAEICDIIRPKIDRKKVAEYLGIAPFTVWAWLNNRTNWPAFAIPAYVNTHNDVKPLELLSEACGYLPVPKIYGRQYIRSIRKSEVSLSILTGKALEIIEIAYADKKITKMEYKEIHSALNELRRLEAEMDLRIRREAIGD